MKVRSNTKGLELVERSLFLLFSQKKETKEKATPTACFLRSYKKLDAAELAQ